jgi:hypothetical protein
LFTFLPTRTQKMFNRNTGNGNIIVQIKGNGNTVAFGRPYLTLNNKWEFRRIAQDLERLNPSFRCTPLIGRQHEMASLQAFLDKPRPISVRVLTGSGGSGKTRLAIELCSLAANSGWHAGFLSELELSRFLMQPNIKEWGWAKPTLIVLDYAAGHAALLRQLIDELVNSNQSPNHALRLILIERYADMNIGWWHTLFQGGWESMDRRALLDPPEPIRIPPLATAEDRLALLQATLDQVEPASTLTLPSNEPDFRLRLMQLDWGGDPLFLMMAALEMVRLNQSNVLTLSRTDLANGLALREADRLSQLATRNGLAPELVKHMAACITLAQGMGREAFEIFAETEKAAIHRPSGGDSAQLADLLQQAFPSQGGIASIVPDLIGEAFVIHVLRSQSSTNSVLRCHAAFGQPVIESTIRCVQDYASSTPIPLQWLEAIAHSGWDDVKALIVLDSSLPFQSVLLANLSLLVSQRLIELLQKNPDTPKQLLAEALNGLALAQIHMGFRELASQSAQQAVDLFRKLEKEGDEKLKPKLAMSLNNLANRLSDFGQREAALAAAEESALLYRELTDQRPEVFKPDLAMALNNLSSTLSEVGQREQAFIATQEAVEIRRELAKARPDIFKPNLASALNNLANRLGELGKHEAALGAAREASELYRELSGQRPDEFMAKFCTSLSNLAITLSHQHKHEAALAISQEATAIFRELTRQSPDVFKPDLAMSLNNLASMLSNLGQLELALITSQEATGIRRELADLMPDVFKPDLATSLNNLGNNLSAVQQFERALEVSQEAVAIRRELADRRPDVFQPKLANSLSDLATKLNSLGRNELAFAAAQESIAIQRGLAERSPDVFNPAVAVSLYNLVSILSDLGQPEQAMAAAQECVFIRRALVKQNPDVFAPGLARSLNTLAQLTYHFDTDMAVCLCHEAVLTLKPAFLACPEAYGKSMAWIIATYIKFSNSINQSGDENLLVELLPHLNKKE